jgi:hypothetical protein
VHTQRSTLVWQLGPARIYAEPLSPAAVFAMHGVGARYRGCFQAHLKQFQTYDVLSARTLDSLTQVRWALSSNYLDKPSI